MKMHNPPYPAEIIREDILPALGISISEAARQLGVSRVTLSRLLHGKTAISADMALRLHAWLGKDSPSPESWLHQQADYDLWQASRKTRPAVLPAVHVPKTL
ncbi:HigA family addiction module antitoxin [Conchiformibius steedae]|uniref:Addiction module antidote protein, HigA family n=1 Tax=Conchiformibius steedae TaxID=153493 RepID=A0A3P1ZZ10_9NEIS|nr:HigA family addiction module antitoxin [Conchiformibius steedae]RRD88045.1 addiction module antidote protein, HigA family [Conchiformibius steedae]